MKSKPKPTTTKKVSRKAKASTTFSVSDSIFQISNGDIVYGTIRAEPPKPPKTYKEAMVKLAEAEVEIKRLRQVSIDDARLATSREAQADLCRAQSEIKIHERHSNQLSCILENFSRSKAL